MAPELAALDRALQRTGEDIILRRISATAPTNVNVTIKALVRSWRLRDEELVNGIFQDVIVVITSPTELARTNWPGVSPSVVSGVDQTLPRKNDEVIIHGRTRNIDAVDAIYARNELVRIEMRVLG